MSARGVVSLWVAAVVAVWVLVFGIAANWAIPIYANVAGPGLCSPGLVCDPGSITPEWMPTLIFAAIVATIATGLLTGMWLLIRFGLRRSCA